MAIRKEHEEIESKLNEARMEGQVSGEKKAKEELQERLAALDQALEHAEEEVRETQGKLNRSVLSGLSVGPSEGIIKGFYAFPSISLVETCRECGKKYEPGPRTLKNYAFINNICPDCKSKS